MAYFRKTQYGWRAEIERRGVKKSQSGFPSKGAAQAWATREESAILSGPGQAVPNKTVGDLLKRYREEVSPTKKGSRWEDIRLRMLERDRIAQVRLRVLDAPHVSDWQQRRLQTVSGASVRRERNLLSAAFELARREWRWLDRNPFKDVSRPQDGKPRARIATPAEIVRLTDSAGPTMRRVIVFALETGMRASEIAGLREVRGSVAYLEDTKNGEARAVPLSQAALEAFSGGFGITAGSISAMFATLCKGCEIKGLTFHDLRRTAITRLASKLTPMELAKMVGHKDLRMTLNVYYKMDPEEIARKL